MDRIRTTLEPGDVGYVIHLHGSLYAREFGLDHTFEADVARGLGEFAKSYDSSKDFFAVAEIDGRIVGSIVIAAESDQLAKLRYFLVHPDARGHGLGRRLMQQALDFCRERGFRTVWLWTISELKAAAHLYREAGFKVTGEKMHEIWGAIRTEQRYDLTL
jgi:ribosomal protein S18 acetylase RimI-like enzyme